MTDQNPAPDDRCDPEWEISPRAVNELRARGSDFVLVDCRTVEEHGIARIDGSLLVPMHDLGTHLPELEAHAERPIIVYCHTGRRSLMVTSALREYGFADVRSMAGGIHRWSQEVDPSVPVY